MKLKYNYLTNKVADSFVAVSTDKICEHKFIKFNETGAFIFEMLKTDVTEDEIISALLKEYEIDNETAKDSVRTFLKYVSDLGIIQYEC